MNAEVRRANILKDLEKAASAISAGRLAENYGVSRQIIVGDIALLRASGIEIIATPRGYILAQKKTGLVRRIPCRHKAQEMKEEMEILVDNGCTILDVIVEHPVYGQLVGQLNASTRYDISEFLKKVEKSEAAPLCGLTGGVHLHTVVCPDETAYKRVTDELRARGFLYE